jgi:hypothetical protein
VTPEDPRALAGALRDARAARPEGIDATREWIREELSRRRYAERMAELFEACRAGRVS